MTLERKALGISHSHDGPLNMQAEDEADRFGRMERGLSHVRASRREPGRFIVKEMMDRRENVE